MAVNFGLLQAAQPVSSFFQGQQDVRQQADQNMLRQAQIEQLGAQRDQRLAMAAERQAKIEAASRRQQFLTGLGAKMAESGYKLDRPTLGQMLQFGMQSGEDSLTKLATEGLKALGEEDLYRRESERLGMAPGAGAATPSVVRQPAAGLPAAPAAPTNLLAGTPFDIGGAAPTAPVNALAAPAAPAGITREMVQQMMTSPSPRIREQGKALAQTLPKESATPNDVAAMQALGFPLTQQGYELFRAAQRQERMLSPEEERQRIRIAQASRPPAQPREPREPALRTQQVTMNDGTLGIMNMDTGQVTPASLGGAPVKGKPSAFAEKNAAQRKHLALDLDRTIEELTSASKKGGLIDQSTGSGAGRLVDIGAAFVGEATPGAIAAGKLAPIADMTLKMVPRFEGPQSNKDTQSYKEAAGQLADTTLPNAIRKNAALEIIRLLKARRDQFVSAEMATEGAGPRTAPPSGVDSSNPLLK